VDAEDPGAGPAAGSPEPPLYSAGVVIAALAFGVTLGLLGGVVLMLFLDSA
jgi:hypothetical protein